MPGNTKSTSAPRPTMSVRWRALYKKIKALQGDPHYVAMGAAIGVFVALTPTIPLHTAIAIGLAFFLKASKPAAAIAVWVSNPITIPFFYYASFKFGTWIVGHEVPLGAEQPTIYQMLKMGWDVTVATVVGGALLGIIPAMVAYFITFRLFQKIHIRRTRRKLSIAHAEDIDDQDISDTAQ